MLRAVFLAILFSGLGSAQTVLSTEDPSGNAVQLGGVWQFRMGDDPRWATSPWDEPGWTAVTSPMSPCGNDFQVASCRFWVRFRVTLPERIPRDVSFTPGPIATASHIFISGQLVNPNEILADSHLLSTAAPIYRIPAFLLKPGETLLFAARCVYYSNGPYSPQSRLHSPLAEIGSRNRIALERVNSQIGDFNSRWPTYVTGLIYLIGGIYLLCIAFSNPHAPEYFWAAGNFTLLSLEVARLALLLQTEWLSARQDMILVDLIYNGVPVLFQRLIFSMLGRKLPLASRIAESVAFIYFLVWLLLVFAGRLDRLPPAFRHSLFMILYSACLLLPDIAVIQEALRGSRLARLFLFAISGVTLSSLAPFVSIWAAPFYPETVMIPSQFQIGATLVRLSDLGGLQFMITMFVLLTQRQNQTRQERERLSAEFEAARELQSSLVPEARLKVGGYRLESVYVPAEEVGGDFFQVLPGDDGSLLVIVGDVSGKGLKAAMVVAIIAGLIRQIVTETRVPARVLEKLNIGIRGQTGSGFVTCACALLTSAGLVVITSAGHLPPYLNGCEVELNTALPLGLAADVEYREASLRMSCGDTLMFLSDGVVEARNKSGELYGFERVRDLLSTRPDVKTIARAARSFGQEDDITAISIERERSTV